MQKALTVGGGTPSPPPPPPSLAPLARAPSLRSLARYIYRPPKIKSWLRHWAHIIFCASLPNETPGSGPGTPSKGMIF